MGSVDISNNVYLLNVLSQVKTTDLKGILTSFFTVEIDILKYVELISRGRKFIIYSKQILSETGSESLGSNTLSIKPKRKQVNFVG